MALGPCELASFLSFVLSEAHYRTSHSPSTTRQSHQILSNGCTLKRCIDCYDYESHNYATVRCVTFPIPQTMESSGLSINFKLLASDGGTVIRLRSLNATIARLSSLNHQKYEDCVNLEDGRLSPIRHSRY